MSFCVCYHWGIHEKVVYLDYRTQNSCCSTHHDTINDADVTFASGFYFIYLLLQCLGCYICP